MGFVDTFKSSIKARLVVGMLLCLLPLGGGLLWSHHALQQRAAAFTALSTQAGDRQTALTGLRDRIQTSATALRDFLLLNDPDAPKRFAAASRDIDNHFRSLADMPGENGLGHTMLAAAQGEWRQIGARTQALFTLKPAPPPGQAAETFRRLDTLFNQEVKRIDRIRALARVRLAEGTAAAQADMDRVTGWATALLWSGALFLVAGGYGLVRFVLTPLHLLDDMSERYRRGELSRRQDLNRSDEVGRIATLFNRVRRELEKSRDRLKFITLHDELTGLLNRREFHHQLDDELNRARRMPHAFSVVMLDIDHFRLVNETHGHLAGDEALQLVALAIGRDLRSLDRLARFESDGFALILPGANAEGARIVSERIRNSVAGRKLILKNGTVLRLTVSLGTACYPEHGLTDEALLASADDALKGAKRLGRNRVSQTAPDRPARMPTG